jgi:glycosyltransferase involved in cell wall biosynthesis
MHWTKVLRVSIIVPGRWHAFDLAREFSELGHLEQLITSYPRRIVRKYGVPDSAIVSLPTTEAVRRTAGRLPRRLQPAVSRWSLSMFARRAAKHLNPCDVVVAWSGVGAPAFRKARAWRALRVCERGSSHIREQEEILAEEHRLQGVPWTAWGEAGRRLDLDDYEAADVISIPSLFVKRSFLRRGFSEHRLLHSPYGVDLHQFEPGPTPPGPPRVAFAGSIGLRKGVTYLVDGFRRASLPDSELWIIGGATSESEHLLGQLGSNVRLWGHVPQTRLAELYAQCSVFVLASVEEGMALVQAQALASGLPLICTTNTGGEDLLRMSLPPDANPEPFAFGGLCYPAGYVVPIRHPEAIACALRDLFEVPGRVMAMRTAAADVARNDLSWAASAHRLLDGYREAAKSLARQRR